jgi:hypothetical protein
MMANWRVALPAAGFAVFASVALAGNVPLLPPTPNFSEPSQVLSTLNTAIQTINANTNGQLAALPAPFATTGTSANTVLAYTVPPGALPNGKAIRMSAWGFNPADANVRTVTFNFGTSAATVLVTGSAALWHVYCEVQNTGTVASPVQSIDCWGKQGTTLVVSSQPASAQDVTTANVAMTLQVTTATSGITTVNGAYFDAVR